MSKSASSAPSGGAPVLMKGNEALGEAAIRAGCQAFFGYPITPQSELPAYMARRMPAEGRVFLQAESELTAINMVYGAGGAGIRVMTSSSSPGISLKQEGISYIAGAEVPAVIVNIMRGGPGLGSIMPGQADYFQAVKGGGHGDYRMVVYGPATVQELVDLTIRAFSVADRYRTPVMILGDGILGQMMEPVVFPTSEPTLPAKPWATTGRQGRAAHNVVNSLYLQAEELEAHNLDLQAKFRQMAADEVMYEAVIPDDAEVICVAYGTTARVVKSAINLARQEGLKAGFIRPISLWPFPDEAFANLPRSVRSVLVVEMSAGQMIEDVRLALNGKLPVSFYGRMGGMWPIPRDVLAEIRKAAGREAGVAQ